MKFPKIISKLLLLTGVILLMPVSCEDEEEKAEAKLIGSWELYQESEILLVGGVEVTMITIIKDGGINVEPFDPEIWNMILETEFGSELESNLDSLEFEEQRLIFYEDRTFLNTYVGGQTEGSWELSEDGLRLYLYPADFLIDELGCDILKLTSSDLIIRLSSIDGETLSEEIDLDNDQVKETTLSVILESRYSKLP